MKRATPSLFILFFCNFILVQAQIKGKVVDFNSNEPFPYATVVLKLKDSIVQGKITDENGQFEFSNIDIGSYTLEVSFIGYREFITYINLTDEEKKIVLPDIFLKINPNQLEEVIVEATRKTIENRIDRKVINISKDLTFSGVSSINILDNLPSVEVDQYGNLSFRGNTNVKLFVNGRITNQSPQIVLRQINPSSIEKIELITNPSAKFNPEGTSGIINIVLKNAQIDNYNGFLSLDYTIGIKPKYEIFSNGNYRKNKINFSGAYSGSSTNYLSNRLLNRLDDNSIHANDFVIDMLTHYGKIGADYFFSKNHQINTYTSLSIWKGDISNPTIISFADDNQNIASKIIGRATNKRQQYNLFYLGNLDDEKQKLSLEVNREINIGDDVDTYLIADYQETTKDYKKDFSMYLDYENNTNQKRTLEFGGAIEIKDQSKVFSSTQMNSESLDYSYQRDIFSIYAQVRQQIVKNLSAQFGLRGETLNESGKSFNSLVYENSYAELYPSLFLMFTKNLSEFSFQYSRRIDRPSFSFVNPIREYSTPSYISIGNIELQPQYTNGLELAYKWTNNTISIQSGVFYRKIKNEIIRTLSLSDENSNLIILSYDNLEFTSSYGIEASLDYKISKNIKLILSADYNQNTLNGFADKLEANTIVPISKDAHNLNSRLVLQYKPTEKWTMQLSSRYRNARDFLQGKYKSRYKTDLAFNFMVLKGQGNISANFTDIFDGWDISYTTNVPYNQVGINDIENQTFHLGFSYSFGGELNNISRKERSNNESQNKSLEIEQ